MVVDGAVVTRNDARLAENGAVRVTSDAVMVTQDGAGMDPQNGVGMARNDAWSKKIDRGTSMNVI